jgi:hypothetical protein
LFTRCPAWENLLFSDLSEDGPAPRPAKQPTNHVGRGIFRKDKQMDCKDIVEAYLKEHGFDGLFNDWGECGCELGDLFPCCESISDCQPGYKHPSVEFDYMIRPDKPKDNQCEK